MSETVEVRVTRETLDKLSKLAERLKTTPSKLLEVIAGVVADYSDGISELGGVLKVRDEIRAESSFEELVFYGLVFWDSVIREVLDQLGALGCYELNEMDFEPSTPYIELEFIALEQCELKADVIVVKWTSSEVVVEAHYYLEDKPKPEKPVDIRFDWFYEPDEHAVVLRESARRLSEAPDVREFDEEASRLGILD